MSSENVHTCKCNGGDVPCVITVQEEMNGSNFFCRCCSDRMKERCDLAYIIIDGDCDNNKENTSCHSVSMPKEELGQFEGSVAGGEPFFSILDRRRLAKKAEEKVELEWKQTIKPDIKTVKHHVLDLVGKLKKHFSEEKQARKQHTASAADRAKYIWNNSVDSFLRHHEKPKIDIQYNEDSGDAPGEGSFTFAVRPSRIRKHETKKQHVCTVPRNTTQETNNTEVFEKKKEVVEGKKVRNHNIFTISNEYILSRSVSSTNKGTSNGYVNDHVISSCHRAPIIFDTFYNHAVTMLNKTNASKSGYGHGVHQNIETASPGEINDKSFLSIYDVQRSTKVHRKMGNIEICGRSVSPFCGPLKYIRYCYSVLARYEVLRYKDLYGSALPSFDNAALNDFPDDTSIYNNGETKLFEQRELRIDKALTSVDVSCQEELLTTIGTSCHDKSPIEEVLTTTHVSGSEEPRPDEVSKNVNISSPVDMSCNDFVTNADASSYEEPPPNENPKTPPSNQNRITTEDCRLNGPAPNHEAITDIFVDESDDDSPFGILSVFCRSELHSRCSAVSEAER